MATLSSPVLSPPSTASLTGAVVLSSIGGSRGSGMGDSVQPRLSTPEYKFPAMNTKGEPNPTAPFSIRKLKKPRNTSLHRLFYACGRYAKRNEVRCMVVNECPAGERSTVYDYWKREYAPFPMKIPPSIALKLQHESKEFAHPDKCISSGGTGSTVGSTVASTVGSTSDAPGISPNVVKDMVRAVFARLEATSAEMPVQRVFSTCESKFETANITQLNEGRERQIEEQWNCLLRKEKEEKIFRNLDKCTFRELCLADCVYCERPALASSSWSLLHVPTVNTISRLNPEKMLGYSFGNVVTVCFWCDAIDKGASPHRFTQRLHELLKRHRKVPNVVTAAAQQIAVNRNIYLMQQSCKYDAALPTFRELEIEKSKIEESEIEESLVTPLPLETPLPLVTMSARVIPALVNSSNIPSSSSLLSSSPIPLVNHSNITVKRQGDAKDSPLKQKKAKMA